MSPATWLLAGLLLAHPGGHGHMDADERYRHALELPDDAAADRLLRSIAAIGHRPAQYHRYAQARHDPARSEPLLWRVAGPVDPDRQFDLGQRWLKGDGMPEDPARAVFWFREAARAGHGMAQVMLASQLDRGDGVGADADQALSWLLTAARAGQTEAQFRLGQRLADDSARIWLERAARGGHTGAQHVLGIELARGGRFPTDEGAAFRWLLQAAEAGHVTSMLLVGWMLKDGRGVTGNAEQALEWLMRARYAGDARAAEAIEALESELDLDQTVSAMTGAIEPLLPDPIEATGYTRGLPVNQMLGFGTGFHVDGEGLIVTNHHVIDACSEIRVSGRGQAELLFSEPVNDIALLRGEPSPAWLELAGKPVTLAQSVRAPAISHPDTDFESVDLIGGTVRALERPGRDGRYFRFDARLEQGASGGPVLDDTDAVIGLVVAKLTPAAAYDLTGVAGQPATFALKPELVSAYLEMHGISPAEPLRSGDPADAVVRVECWY